jgi:environmental stress-induced protein Ves
MKSGSLQLSPLRFAALADMPEQPWRNGAGRTRELLAWPTSSATRRSPSSPASTGGSRSSAVAACG